jgi:hypothetical protein
MQTFYSILSAVINPSTGEKISLGLLLSDGNQSLFHFSDNRLTLLNDLLDKETKKFVRLYLKSIENIIEKYDVNQNQLTIFEETGKNVIINEPYIAYLSAYNQNVITFSRPVLIDIPVNQEIFSSLFVKFIDNESNIKSGVQKNIQIVKTEFLPKIRNFYSVEKEMTPLDFPNLILPVTIDFMGMNDEYVIGQFFELEKSINFIKSDYFDYQQIKETIQPGKRFIISSEPEKIRYPQQHYFWDEIRKQQDCTYLDINELEEIESYAIQHGVKPVE